LELPAQRHHLTRAVWIATALYAVIMTALGIDRYVTYRSGEDLGVFVQAIADAAHGMHDQGEFGSHFNHHFSPILYLCAPFLLAVRSPIALIAIQAIAGALIAPAIYLLARSRLDARLSSLSAIASLLYPPLVGVTFTEFHENGFAPAVVAWLLYAVDARRFTLAGLFALLALAIKEDEAYILAVLGAGYAVWCAYHKDKAGTIFGAGVSVAAVLVLVVFFAIVLPLAGTHSWFAFQNYATAIHGTAQGSAAIFGRLSYLIEAFGPLLFLPLRSPWVLLAVPGLAEVLVSRWPITYTMGQHYAGVWIGYVLAAFVMAAAAIAQTNPKIAYRLSAWCIGVCVAVNVLASPAHWGHYLGVRTAHDRSLDRTLALIPQGASAGSVDEIFVHMSLNPQARAGYDGGLDYLVADSQYDSHGWRDHYRPQLERQLSSGRYRVISTDDGITLYQRQATPRF
jgi:uncharacterized membrane protein